ncbi:MAG: hypothetical protein GY862_38895 [Gammaproteobacteria bacterium]|nr:hypothetical protein [Gammaproteobacteria bacterium]
MMTQTEALTTGLQHFVDSLRLAGFNVGADQYIAAQDLILNLAARNAVPEDLSRLRGLLGPLLCSTPKEQTDFPRYFYGWINQYREAPETLPREASETLPGLLETDGEFDDLSKGAHRRHWFSLVVPPVLLGLGLAFLSWLPQINLPTWLLPAVIIAFLALVVSTALWWHFRAAAFLTRRSTRETPELVKLFVDNGDTELFKSLVLIHAAQHLRKHAELETDHLDVEATIAQTIANGGLFCPISGCMKILPEYLALVDRAACKDHQARLADTLIAQLAAQDIAIEDLYYFDSDPRLCYAAHNPVQTFALPELAERHPRHRLMLFADSHSLINPANGEPYPWVERFHTWPERVLFTPEAPENWGFQENLLRGEDFLIVPISEAGIAALAERTNKQREAVLETGAAPAYPCLLDEHRWLERTAPDAVAVANMLDQLREYLGEAGYLWFNACAVYPELHWQLTLYIGYTLEDPALSSPRSLNPDRLALLVRLPWFRQGFMPDWLRRVLIDDLSLAQEKQIRLALYNLLARVSPDAPLEDFRLDIAKRPGLAALARQIFNRALKQADKRSPLQDYVFQRFMSDSLAVKAPKLIKKAVRVSSDTFRKKIEFLKSEALLEVRKSINAILYVGTNNIKPHPAPDVFDEEKINDFKAIQLPSVKKQRLVELLLECPGVQDAEIRRALVAELPSRIAGAIKTDNNTKKHVLNIVNACMNYSGGLEHLIETVGFFDEKTVQFHTLMEFINKSVAPPPEPPRFKERQPGRVR